ncbi:tRNA (guanine(37)-N1)-methyltransferase-like [Homarus americanus]|uniref:tRNA (guanine(37)-N1)-methyltransferase-like n=1 Tax=Homarus americanus TaxID=6706 RepID=UPI001C465F7E|nr:tRNA (guanine(37)-N1)-methyltransferase-like [Homarus americanus]
MLEALRVACYTLTHNRWYFGVRASLDFILLTSQPCLEYTPRKLIHLHKHLLCTERTEDFIDLKQYFKFSSSLRSLRKNMDVSLLLPPASVKGMTDLNQELFQKKIVVPHVIVKNSKINSALKCLKKHLLKIDKLKPVRSDDSDPDKRVVLLNPLLVRSLEDIEEDFGNICNEGDATFLSKEITLSYENWKAEDILKAVLPDNQEGAQSYSIIGHILHLNLREHMFPYKALIGQVFLDKIPNISLVVNKTNNIDSTYRNFQMEVLAGAGDTLVTVKENGCTYSLDFAKVYWNPRLSTEHERIVKKLKQGDVLYDVMAGIGPFAIPAGRRKCLVWANDLNPVSYDALVKNCATNKVKDRVKCYNLDGHEFIKSVLKSDLLEKWQDSDFCNDIHITMNLPAIAVEFLSAFVGLYHNVEGIPHNPTLPMVHVYMFTSDVAEDIALGMVAEHLGYPCYVEQMLHKGDEPLKEHTMAGDEQVENNTEQSSKTKSQNSFGGLRQYVQEVVNIRKVAPNKIMMRVSVRLPLEVLLKDADTIEEPPCKKIKEL